MTNEPMTNDQIVPAAGPLQDITVLDLSWALAGPYASMILADLGAEVWKVEQPGTGDFARENGPFIHGSSSYFLSLNRGKKSLVLNLRTNAGREVLLDLARRADVLLENFRPGVMARLGLDYARLREVNPRLIYAACTGYGQSGPYATRGAWDIIIQAMGGVMGITGEADGLPTRVGYSIGDMAGSLFTAIGVLAALHHREQSGEGQFVDVALLDCQAALCENALSRYFATGQIPGREGTAHPVVAPFQAFPTADDPLVIAAGHREQWDRFLQVLGLLELKDDPRFQTTNDRRRNLRELEALLFPVTRRKTAAEWQALLEAADVPCGPVQRIDQVAVDPQLHARGMFTEVQDTTGHTFRVVNSPLRLRRTPGAARGPAPALGEHTEAILRDRLGYSPERIAALRAAGTL